MKEKEPYIQRRDEQLYFQEGAVPLDTEDSYNLFRHDDEISPEEIAKIKEEISKINLEKRNLASKFKLPKKTKEVRLHSIEGLKSPVRDWSSRNEDFYVGFDYEGQGSRGDSESVKREYLFPNGISYSVEALSEKGDNQIEIMTRNFNHVFWKDYNLAFFGEGVHVSKRD